MRFIFCILVCFFSIFCFSQTQHTIHLPQTTAFYEREANDSLENKIRKKYTALGEKKDIVEAYIRELRDSRKYYFNSDLEYTDWQEANIYLQKIVNELYKNDSIKPGAVKIRLIRDPEINASAHEDGIIYVNVGMLARLNSEAQMASVFGHEWGHVRLGHNYNGFKSYIHYVRSHSLGNAFGMMGFAGIGFGIAGLVVRKVSASEYEDDLISNETEADKNAILSSKRSQYSNIAGLEAEKLFFRIEEKEKSKVGYQAPRNYIKTHPSTKTRIELFKKAIAGDSIAKKNFIVDSSYFVKLKEQAIDETIYLFFKHQNFDDCIERSFTQYLKYPKDHFYLFFLVESIRRRIAENKFIADKNFITGMYVLKPKKVTKPLAITSEKYKINIIGEFVYQNSIFFHLNDLLFIDSSEVLKNKQLCDTDTLEFITYADALRYFKNEAKINNCIVCQLEEAIKAPATVENISAQNNVEDYYNKLPAIYNAYLSKKTGPEQKNLLIIQGFNNYAAVSFGTEEDDSEIKFKQDLLNYGEKTYPGKYETPEKLKRTELNAIYDYYAAVNNNLPKSTANSPYRGMICRDYDCKAVFPEITEILNKYNYDKVFYVSAANYDYGTYSNDYCLVTMIDFKKNKIAKSGKKLGNFSSTESYEKCMDMINELNK